ncbi:MAG TPA: HlyD family efflux transporter periplasmic adaptor subunit [Candidatus Krumholzibacteria bacterium]|nr:HlyD family efflux transporter periplasmic adaptor subunit [Candidatus Krumholzibacteria bacterium]
MRRAVIILIVVVGGLFAWLVTRGGASRDEVYTGTLVGRDVRVGSLVGGRVAGVAVMEGDSVHPGDVIVRLESEQIDAQVREQRARVAQAQAAYDRVVTGPRREEIERARIEWERAEKERKRLEALLAQSLAADADYDNAAAAAGQAYQAYEELRRGSRSEDQREAAGVLAAAEGQLDYLLEQQREMVVRSPDAGVVQTFVLRPGDMVAAGQAVASILPRTDLDVHVYVPEDVLGTIRVGQRAKLTIDTFPGRPFDAIVVAIRDMAEYTPRNIQTPEQRKDRVFAVKLSVPIAPELKPGLTATVRFE